MLYFKAKMHQIRFRLGLCPRPRWGSLQRSPRPPARFKGPTSKGTGGDKGNEGGKGKKREETIPPPFLSHFKPCLQVLPDILFSRYTCKQAEVFLATSQWWSASETGWSDDWLTVYFISQWSTCLLFHCTAFRFHPFNLRHGVRIMLWINRKLINWLFSKSAQLSLQRTGGDHEDAPASYGWAPYSRISDPTISHCLKQWIWPRTGFCGGCGRRTALRNLELHARNDDDRRINWLVFNK